MARFTTLDPSSESYYSWSQYAYTFNSPVNFIDPTGAYPDDDPPEPIDPMPYLADGIHPYDYCGRDWFGLSTYDNEGYFMMVMEGVMWHRNREVGMTWNDYVAREISRALNDGIYAAVALLDQIASSYGDFGYASYNFTTGKLSRGELYLNGTVKKAIQLARAAIGADPIMGPMLASNNPGDGIGFLTRYSNTVKGIAYTVELALPPYPLFKNVEPNGYGISIGIVWDKAGIQAFLTLKNPKRGIGSTYKLAQGFEFLCIWTPHASSHKTNIILGTSEENNIGLGGLGFGISRAATYGFPASQPQMRGISISPGFDLGSALWEGITIPLGEKIYY